MNYSNPQNSCHHQLVFASALDDAATCARCGAIALIEHKNGVANITWIDDTRQSAQTDVMTEIATSD